MWMSLGLLMTGCVVVPRTGAGLRASACPKEPVVLLPITVDDVGYCGVPTNKMVRVGNQVLNELASSGAGHLVRPSTAMKALDGLVILPALTTTRNSSAVTDAETEAAMLRLAERRLGAKQVIRTRLYYSEDTPQVSASEGGVATTWGGEVRAKLELWELAEPRLVRTANGYHGHTKVTGVVLMFPFYAGNTFGRAVEGAIREGLNQLLAEQ